MEDGHFNKCKTCTRKDTREREEILRNNPEWVEKEKKRGREKYHRLYSNNSDKNLDSEYNVIFMEKEEYIKFRISKTKKQDWKKICKDRNLTLTDLLTASVENRILDNERRQILAFIEKQDNVFIKIETNINQVAKIANGQKFISESELKNFTAKLSEITKLKKQQNQIFKKIYEMLAK